MKDIKKRALLIHVIGAMIARAAFFDINPLSIGYFTAAYLQKAGGGMAFIAAMVGLLSVTSSTQILKYTMAMLTSIIIMESPILKKRNIPQPILYLLPTFFLCVYSFMEAATFQSMSSRAVWIILEGTIAYVSGFLFKNGIDFLLRAAKGFKMNNEQMVSIAVILTVAVYAVPDASSSYIAPMETCVYFIILFFTYKYGIGLGTITAAISGFAMNLRGASVSEVALLTMMGIIPAVFREMGRIPTAVIYMITASTMRLFYEGKELTVRQLGALISAVLIFLLLPRSINYRIDATEDKRELATGNLKKIAKTKIKVFSESFRKLSKTLDTITEKQTKLKQQEINRVFEDISEKLCKNCSNCTSCWEHNLEDTYQATCNMFEIAEKNGVLQREDIPLGFLASCINAEEFVAQTNHSFEILKLNHIWYNRIAESREVIANQLKEVSNVIEEITGDIYSTALASKVNEEKIARVLKAENIMTKDITIVERGDKRKEIYLAAACRAGRCVTAKEAAGAIGEALGIRVKLSEASKTVISREFDNFIFVEDTNFKVLTGVARAMKENVSGDNFSILKLETGEVMVALSDGMGTGREAGEESETVMSLLEQMIEAGFKAETAIRLINSNLVLKSDKQTFSTIDMSVLNLFTGICEFIKIGAAATFIKRDNWVETITSTTLPIGMLGNVDYDAVTKKLYEGDIVIMVTDGVLDCIQDEDKEAYMEHFIMEIKSTNPQEIANRILDGALSQSNYVPRDDMTILTIGLWSK